MKTLAGLLGCLLFISCTVKTPYRTALLGSPMNKYDPIGLSEINEITLVSQICGRLTAVDEFLNIEGDLADSWTISPDRKSYSFKLRDDRHFVDGSLVTVDDVIFSINRIAHDKASTVSSWANDISSITKAPDGRLKVELHYGDPRFLFKLSHPRFCVISRDHPFLMLNGTSVPNSSGSYRVVSQDINNKTILLRVANDYAGKARESEIQVRFLKQNEAIAEFRVGHLNDLSFYLLEGDEIRSVEDRSNILNAKIFWTWIAIFNPSRPLFSSLTARKSFLSAFKRDLFLKNWGSELRQSSSLIPYGMRGYLETVPVGLSQSDIKFKFSCKTPARVTVIEGMPAQAGLQRAIISEISRITGCGVVVKFLEMADYVKDQAVAASDVYIQGIDTNSNDPLGFFRDFRGGSAENYLHFSNREFEVEFDRLYSVAQEERTDANYVKVHQRLADAAYVVPIGHPNFKFVYSKDVQHMHMNPLGMHLNRWWKIGRK